MKTIPPILFLIISLFGCSAEAASTVTPSRINIPPLPSISQDNVIGLKEGIADNSDIFQGYINTKVATATTANETVTSPLSIISAGKYNFTSGVTTRPWIHTTAVGNAWLNFSGMTTGTAIYMHNEDAPTGSGATVSAGNGSPSLSGTLGAMLISGAGKTSSTVGVRLGPLSYVSGTQRAMRDVRLTGLRIQDFGTCIQVGKYNTYLAEINDTVLSRCGVCLGTDVGASGAQNAGERMTIRSGTCGSSSTGIYIDNDTSWTANDYSIDFATGEAAVLFGENARYNVHYFNNMHLEGATVPYFKSKSQTASYTKAVSGVTSGTGGKARFAATAHGMAVGRLVWHKDFTESGYNGYARVSAISTDWYETIIDYSANDTGNTLVLDSVHQPYVVGKNLHIVTANSYVPAWPNAPAQALFKGNMTLDIDGLFVGGYGDKSAAAEGMFMVDDAVTVKRVRDVSFTGWRQMIAKQTLANSDPYFSQGVAGESILSTWSRPTSGSNNMDMVVDGTTVWSAGGASKSLKFTPTGVSNFYVLYGDRFNVASGERLIANLAVYGGTSVGGQVSLEIKFWSSSNADLPVTSMTASGDTLDDIYGDTSDPAYTGDRLWWAKMSELPFVVVPAGYDQASLVLTVASVTSGDVFIGFAGVNKI